MKTYEVIHRVSKQQKEILLTDIVPNEYNPNSMPMKEKIQLAACVLIYGFLFPILVVWHPEKKKYIIIDGYHRWLVLTSLADSKSIIFKKACQFLGIKKDQVKVNNFATCVVLDISLDEAMVLTVLMNRIKGSHKVSGMADLVTGLSDLGKEDVAIAKILGMEGEEYIRLNQQKGKGVAESFRNHSYSKSWEIKS